jgi:hemerythrin-like domain-containing protein
LPTQNQVLSAYSQADDYGSVGQLLNVPAGQAYLVATGLPADGGTYSPGVDERPGLLSGSTQHLAHGTATESNPTAKPQVHEWVKRMAATDAPMQAAARRRDAAPGDPLESEDTDMITVLTRQHDRVTALIKQLKTVPGVSAGGSGVHQSRRSSIVDMITVALSKHEATEQEHFWPWVRSIFDDGDEMASTAFEQEQQGKDVLTALSKTEASDEHFDELAQQLELRARKHVAFEDRVLLALHEATSAADRAAVGARFLQAEARAPTRPHRHAPKRPGAAVKAAGAAGAVIDAARDKLGDRPAERRGRAAEVEAADEGLSEEK